MLIAATSALLGRGGSQQSPLRLWPMSKQGPGQYDLIDRRESQSCFLSLSAGLTCGGGKSAWECQDFRKRLLGCLLCYLSLPLSSLRIVSKATTCICCPIFMVQTVAQVVRRAASGISYICRSLPPAHVLNPIRMPDRGTRQI